MKFVHLGDLHIGKRVNDFLMIKDQEYILNQIIEILVDEKVDAVLIAGDVYDKAVPSAEAVTLFDDFLTRIAKLGIKTYIISGNHDSAERLAFARNLMGEAGVYVSSVFKGQVQMEVYEDEYGEVNIYMLPFIKPIQVKKYMVNAKVDREATDDDFAQVDGGFARKNDEEQQIIDSKVEKDDNVEEISWDNYDIAYKMVMDSIALDKTKRNIIMTHQFVTGADICDSEELAISGLDNISVSHFDGYDYVALGHIHRAQKLIKDTIRYSGTPLKYSLSEMNHKKSVTVVDMKDKDNIDIKLIDLKPLHDMRHIKGTYEEISYRENYINTDTSDYMHITLTDEEDVPDAIGKLRTIYPNIMKLDYDNTRTRQNMEIEVTKQVEEKKPIELFSELYEMQNNKELTPEQEEYMRELIDAVWDGRE